MSVSFFIMRKCLIVSRLVDGYNNEILKVGDFFFKEYQSDFTTDKALTLPLGQALQ